MNDPFISLKIYALLPHSTVDRPEYKYCSQAYFALKPGSFETLADFEQLIISNTQVN